MYLRFYVQIQLHPPKIPTTNIEHGQSITSRKKKYLKSSPPGEKTKSGTKS